jgi:hypothetical protein
MARGGEPAGGWCQESPPIRRQRWARRRGCTSSWVVTSTSRLTRRLGRDGGLAESRLRRGGGVGLGGFAVFLAVHTGRRCHSCRTFQVPYFGTPCVVKSTSCVIDESHLFSGLCLLLSPSSQTRRWHPRQWRDPRSPRPHRNARFVQKVEGLMMECGWVAKGESDNRDAPDTSPRCLPHASAPRFHRVASKAKREDGRPAFLPHTG